MTPENEQPRHHAEAIRDATLTLPPPAPSVNVPFRFWPVGELCQYLERRPADLLAELDRFDVYRGPTGRLRLVRPETAAKLIAAQLGEVP